MYAFWPTDGTVKPILNKGWGVTFLKISRTPWPTDWKPSDNKCCSFQTENLNFNRLNPLLITRQRLKLTHRRFRKWQASPRPAHNLIVDQSAILKMAHRPTVNLYAAPPPVGAGSSAIYEIVYAFEQESRPFSCRLPRTQSVYAIFMKDVFTPFLPGEFCSRNPKGGLLGLL